MYRVKLQSYKQFNEVCTYIIQHILITSVNERWKGGGSAPFSLAHADLEASAQPSSNTEGTVKGHRTLPTLVALFCSYLKCTTENFFYLRFSKTSIRQQVSIHNSCRHSLFSTCFAPVILSTVAPAVRLF